MKSVEKMIRFPFKDHLSLTKEAQNKLAGPVTFGLLLGVRTNTVSWLPDRFIFFHSVLLRLIAYLSLRLHAIDAVSNRS